MNENTDIPSKSLRRARVRVVVRWVLGSIFVGAGVIKIAHPVDFYSNLLAYDVSGPDWLFRLVAVVFPWLEVACGGLLLAGYWTESVGFLVASMCAVFVFMLGQAVARGLDLKCGCFGPLTIGWLELPQVALVRAALLLTATIWLLYTTPITNTENTVLKSIDE